MILFIPVTAIVAVHRRGQFKIQLKMSKEQIEPEKMKKALGCTPAQEKEEVLSFVQQKKQQL